MRRGRRRELMRPMTTKPPTLEMILCFMHDMFLKATLVDDVKVQLKLLGMMSRVAMYLHKAKHKNGHYMTSMDALRSLTDEEEAEMMENSKRLAMENGWEEEIIELPDGRRISMPKESEEMIEAEKLRYERDVFYREVKDEEARREKVRQEQEMEECMRQAREYEAKKREREASGEV
jgi:hypothetical protein